MKEGEKYLMGNYARFPLVLKRGNGATVVDVDGKRYLDFVSGVAVNVLGHCDPRVVKTLQKQAETLLHVSNLYYNLPQIELAKLLVTGSFAEQVFFCNSGAEANEAAIKLARKYAKEKRDPGRFEIIAAHGSFHGRTLATVTATGQEKYQKGFEPLLPGFLHVPYGDPGAIEKAITPRTAALLLEPIQGEGGVRIPPKGYLARVREICDAHRLLLILDEVQTGIGRTGRLFAYEQEGILPDIMTLAKGLGGGVPIGAMLATGEVAASFTPGSHASTFGGNPLVCAAGVAVMKQVARAPFLKGVRERGGYLMKRLSELQQKSAVIKEVRGMGLMVAIDLTVPAAEVINRAMSRGLLLNKTSDQTLRFVPPLTIRRQEIDRMISILSDLLEEEK
ncbi:MAG: acetylornithine transaminase [Nitrospirae bacterium]|nr:acetylornithine transaminase [Candidatus Manganitrophaceae bacterium]